MAILLNDGLLGQLSGRLGNIVIKHYKHKTVITVMPVTKTKKSRKPSKIKKLYENNFAAAVKYAQSIIRDPKLKKAYEKKVKPGQQVYNYAIAEYARKFGVKKTAVKKAAGK